MNLTSARAIEAIVYNLRLAEYKRSLNRSRINQLADGWPPYNEHEAEKNNISINVNDLALTRLAHDARSQLYQAFEKPGAFFTARTDFGPKHKRQERGMIVTKEVNRLMKRSLPYMECMRSKFSSNVLHGIGPSCWEDQDHWCGIPLGIGDVLVPANTLLTMRNLPFFAIWRGYTAWELHKLTQGPNRDPGWQMDVVEQAIRWADETTMKAQPTTWSEYWSPEKYQQRLKEDNGLFASDIVQTIDCYDVFYLSDEGGTEGWQRRIIFDAYGGSGAWGTDYGPNGRMPEKNLLDKKEGLFLYNSGDRKWASKLSEIVHFQFADLSAVGPFRYHSVRSLGFMLYAVCHLQNRLRCKFGEAVFENLMMYLRVKSLDDVERALKVELVSRGVIDESVSFLRPDERWQPNAQLAELGMGMYDRIIQENSSSYTQNQNFSRDRTEKTKYQVMAEVNAMTTLISAALQQAYTYQNFEYLEIFRRFCKVNSRDVDVREFRARCLKAGVPEKMLVPEAWELTPERVMGAGNKTMEMAIAQQLMQWRAAYPPEGQQQILRSATLAITDDPGMTDTLVPETPTLSDAKHDAMLAFGSLMAGGEVEFRADQNRIDITETLIGELALGVKRTLATGGMATMQQLQGFQNVVMHVEALIQQINKDPEQKERAKQYAQALGKLSNEIKGFQQRLEQQMKAQQQNGGLDGKDRAKIAATLIQAKAKAANMRESHGARTAQKEVQFGQKLKQQEQQHQLDMKKKLLEAKVDVASKDLETAASIRRDRLKPAKE